MPFFYISKWLYKRYLYTNYALVVIVLPFFIFAILTFYKELEAQFLRLKEEFKLNKMLNEDFEDVIKEIDEIIRELQEVKRLIPQPSKKKR